MLPSNIKTLEISTTCRHTMLSFMSNSYTNEIPVFCVI